ncbi:TadE/TadG family type IV pilus assembly protein [Henriciella sp. AS95]|uniref:TadE/TadG family type IV pilus assembly protein n=1 Tax=Henriciella sp. AS95 TaxID=3135782 RepID=UPI00317C5162
MRFIQDSRASTAMMFALFLVPLLMMVGAAIDMTRHRTATVQAQTALDAALLYVAHESGKREDSVLEQEAKALFRAEMTRRNLDYKAFRFQRVDNSLTATAEVSIDTTLLALAGIESLSVKRESGVKFSDSRVEMALALDTTGSMKGDKLAKLKDASVTLVNKLATGTSDPERRKFSLVAFATWVNVGPSNATAEWIDMSGDSIVSATNLLPDVNRAVLYEKLGQTWPGCVEARSYPYDTDDTAPTLSDAETLFTPAFYPDEPDDRSRYPNDYLDDTGVSSNIMDIIQHVSKYGLTPGFGLSDMDGEEVIEIKSDYDYYYDISTPVGPGFMCAIRPIIPLTTDASLITSEIDKLEAQGSTNITEGIAWAWRTLSPEVPYTGGVAYDDDKTQKIIVLLSDGNNSIGRRGDARGSDYSAYGYIANGRLGLSAGASQRDIYDEMDARTLESCTNAKRAGVIIYTIRLELSGDYRSEALLKSCATSPGHYLDVPDADDLEAVFSDIADDVLDLYLSK